jgi:hypothetical protein
MASPQKCANPVCKCMVVGEGAFGKYCSEHCEQAKDVSEIRCDCKHPACS